MLEQALSGLPATQDPRVLVGLATADDAGVYQLTEDLAIISTVDYFTPIVDDPFTFGAIAVTNALSDVYAMGGEPRTALNIVLWDCSIPEAALNAILCGGADALERAGCALLGGHSVDAPELMYGAAITGTVHPKQVVRNCDARPGDQLILTKRLGVGILTTAAKARKISEAELQPAIDSMLELNDVAASVLREFGAHASTDVTGFGLVGHGYEMAKGSGVAIRFNVNAVPVFDRVLELVRKKIRTRAPVTNAAYVGDRLLIDGDVPHERRQIVLEAETSGGLLMAFPPQRAEAALEALHARGCVHAAIVGEVVDGPSGEIVLHT